MSNSQSPSNRPSGTSWTQYGTSFFNLIQDSADYFMGESETEADRLLHSQRKVDREARKAEGRGYLADKEAEAHRARIDRLLADPKVKEQLARGETNRALMREIQKEQTASLRTHRIDSVSDRLSVAADSLTETGSDLRVAEAALTTAEALEYADYAMNPNEENDADGVAARLEEAQMKANDNRRTFDRALGGKSHASRNQNAERIYHQYAERVRVDSITNAGGTSRSMHTISSYVMPNPVPRAKLAPSPLASSKGYTTTSTTSTRSAAAAAAASSSGGGGSSSSSSGETQENVPSESELLDRVSRLRGPP